MYSVSPYKLIYDYVPKTCIIIISIKKNGVTIHKMQVSEIKTVNHYLSFINKLTNEDISDIIYFNITTI